MTSNIHCRDCPVNDTSDPVCSNLTPLYKRVSIITTIIIDTLEILATHTFRQHPNKTTVTYLQAARCSFRSQVSSYSSSFPTPSPASDCTSSIIFPSPASTSFTRGSIISPLVSPTSVPASCSTSTTFAISTC